MINFSVISWCFMLCMQFRKIFSLETVTIPADDTLLMEGHCINSSDIKVMMTDRTISKIYVYVVNTFYADEDLKLNGIVEIQIFANTWHITRPVTFDLTASDGANPEPMIIKGSAGNSGNAGINGGNFFGLGNEIINGAHLTVISNGGNGGDGQDAIASDDINVTFNEDNDIGDSGWFSTADLHNYYERYFKGRGYDPVISGINDYTSFYALFVHDKKASFNIRLHPRRCCGTTGKGGAGGRAGRSGTLVFKYAGKKPASIPKFVANHGSAGKMGKDAKTCESLAVDVRIDTELKKIVFLFLPLHHSFTSQFTVLNHINSSKCAPQYVEIIRETKVLQSAPTEVKIVSPILRYKRFLLENMKNESLTTFIQKAYESIDGNTEINDEYSLDALLSEACELEKNYFELKNFLSLVPLYQRLSDRIDSLDSNGGNEDEQIAETRLRLILSMKLRDLREDDNFIVNIELFTEVAVAHIKTRNARIFSKLNINDVGLQNNLNRLQFGVNGNYMLDMYYHVINGFQLTFFPFAVDYLEMYQLPASFMAFEDLNAISSATINSLHTLGRTINAINSNHARIVMYKNYMDKNAFYTWKNSDVRDKIRQLFAGEKITLLADVKQSENQFNAIKFNSIELVFRTPVENFNDRLYYVLGSFMVKLNHTGTSAFRCNDKFYELTSDPMFIMSSFEKDTLQVPQSRNLVYDMLRENRPLLSPYTLWEIQLGDVHQNEGNFHGLEPFIEFVDIELHGTGQYIRERASICANENLANFYSVV